MNTDREQKETFNLSKSMVQYDPYEKIYQIITDKLSNWHPIIFGKEIPFKINFKSTANKLTFLNIFQNIKVNAHYYCNVDYNEITYKFKTKDLITHDTYIILKLTQPTFMIHTCKFIFEMKNIFKLINCKFDIDMCYFVINKFCPPPNKIAFKKTQEEQYTSVLVYDEHNKCLSNLKQKYVLIPDIPILYVIRYSRYQHRSITLGSSIVMKCKEIQTKQNISILCNKGDNYKLSVIDVFGNRRKFMDCFDVFELEGTNINDDKTSINCGKSIYTFKKKENKKLFFNLREFNTSTDDHIYSKQDLSMDKIKEKYNIDLFNNDLFYFV